MFNYFTKIATQSIFITAHSTSLLPPTYTRYEPVDFGDEDEEVLLEKELGPSLGRNKSKRRCNVCLKSCFVVSVLLTILGSGIIVALWQSGVVQFTKYGMFKISPHSHHSNGTRLSNVTTEADDESLHSTSTTTRSSNSNRTKVQPIRNSSSHSNQSHPEMSSMKNGMHHNPRMNSMVKIPEEAAEKNNSDPGIATSVDETPNNTTSSLISTTTEKPTNNSTKSLTRKLKEIGVRHFWPQMLRTVNLLKLC